MVDEVPDVVDRTTVSVLPASDNAEPLHLKPLRPVTLLPVSACLSWHLYTYQLAWWFLAFLYDSCLLCPLVSAAGSDENVCLLSVISRLQA